MEENQYFIPAEKDIVIQTIQISQNGKRNSNHKLSSKQKELAWKFQSTKNYYIPSPSKINPRNISFQTQSYSQESFSLQCDYQKQFQSALSIYYKSYQQVYLKRTNLGTNSIGNHQYYASIFVDLQKIQKSAGTFTPFNNTPSIKETSDCLFDSDFQSGNLYAAYKIGVSQYDLILQNDINTKGNTQWFYFRVTNLKPKQIIKINIVNLMKPDSLFNYGMLPCVHSMQCQVHTGQGWQRKGAKVTYKKTNNQMEHSKRNYYCLSFQISTNYVNDVLKIAHCYPYTVTDLKNYLDIIIQNNYKKGIIQRNEIGKTIGKNTIEVITIKQFNPRRKTRDTIVILARQHPGQTPSSFVCEGLIDFLLSKDKQADYLRKNCQFKIIPMINPDGVYIGNYRSNLLGVDLNRRWGNGQKNINLLESIMVKNYLTQLNKKSNIGFILDLHGHSRKMFSFFYGNPSINDPLSIRIFPYLCSKLYSNVVRFQDSTFCYAQNKRKTARVQLNLNFKIPNIFTFQTSFFGYITKDAQKRQFTPESYRSLGLYLGKAIFIQQRQKNNIQSKQAIFYQKLLNDLKTFDYLLKNGNNDDSGSQSNPSQCQLGEKQLKRIEQIINPIDNKKQFIKKIIKREILSKEINRQPRIMQILDIPRVHSIFPHDLLALIPNSYLNKLKKEFKNASTQTQQHQFFKIYQICKSSNLNYSSPKECSNEIRTNNIHKGSNLLKTVIRPKSSTYNVLNKSKKLKKTNNQVQAKKVRNQSGADINKAKIYFQSKQTQTIISFTPSLRISIIQQQSKQEIKNNSVLRDLMLSTIQQRKLNPKVDLRPGFKTLTTQFSLKKKINC